MANEPESTLPQGLERKLATILSADVAEYSRLMNEDEEGTLKTFRGHKQVFESLVAMHRGRIFNTAGDAILAEFNSAVEALRCATEIQAALRTLNDQLPVNRQVRFRIGVNLGDVMIHGQDLLGDGVNVAARLQSAAEPGGICISGSVHDQIRNKLSLSFKSLGDKSFKNIPQPVRTFSVTEAEGLGALPSPKDEKKSGAGKWIAAAVIVLLAGGGYWAYSRMAQNKAGQTAITQAVVAQPVATDTKAATPDAKPAAASPNTKTETPKQPAVAKPEAAHPAAPASEKASRDGLYSGKICYGKGPRDIARCFNQQGTVSNGRISAEWENREAGFMMILEGTVSASGEVEIHMHNKGAAALHMTQIDMTGTLHDGHLEAAGSFRNGRPANLNWTKNSASGQ